MEIDQLRTTWHRLGQVDPMWAICADNSKHGNRWDADAFFASGRRAVADVQRDLAMLNRSLSGRALDFGCGLGRLTQALAVYCDDVVGVDVAPSMIEGADRYNAFTDRVTYRTNETDNLHLFDDNSFDAILSLIVLQHMRNDLKACYLREMVRILKPGGTAYVTIPEHPNWKKLKGLGFMLLPNRVLNTYRRLRFGYDATMELYGVKSAEIRQAVESAGGEMIDITEHSWERDEWVMARYVFSKPAQ